MSQVDPLYSHYEEIEDYQAAAPEPGKWMNFELCIFDEIIQVNNTRCLQLQVIFLAFHCEDKKTCYYWTRAIWYIGGAKGGQGGRGFTSLILKAL